MRDDVHFYSGTIPFDLLPFPAPDPEVDAEFDWASADMEVRRRYGGLVVAVFDRKVWGAGKSHREAWDAARANSSCPALDRIVLVPVSALPPDNIGQGAGS